MTVSLQQALGGRFVKMGEEREGTEDDMGMETDWEREERRVVKMMEVL